MEQATKLMISCNDKYTGSCVSHERCFSINLMPKSMLLLKIVLCVLGEMSFNGHCSHLRIIPRFGKCMPFAAVSKA